METIHLRLGTALLLALTAGCADGGGGSANNQSRVFGFANTCVTVEYGQRHLKASGDNDESFAFSAATRDDAGRFFMKPSRLGTYLFYDRERGYLASDGAALLRLTELESDVTLIDDTFESRAEWVLESLRAGAAYRLQHRRTGAFLGIDGLVTEKEDAVDVVLRSASGCTAFPEEGTHTEGEVSVTEFEDGDLFGVVDAHSHILANFAFGGGGIVHGAPFHPLGVEHALGDCDTYHGTDGRSDFAGAVFRGDTGGSLEDLVNLILSGRLPTPNHETQGYPDFTDWPSSASPTHQTQYYKWIERAYRGGLRLIVQHAVSNQILCDLVTGRRIQRVRYACNDMVAVDRQIDEIYNMQDYIDAQEGGPGKGWFRIVTSTKQAREVIRSGKLAVILGIETSNLFDCFLTPPQGFQRCTEEDVVAKLDDYYDRGIRVLFPVHKYDNAFSSGDGMKDFIELGNFIQTGHFGNFVEDCDASVPTVFDRGRSSFQGILHPRDDYLAPPAVDMSRFPTDPLNTLFPFIERLLEPGDPNVTEHCQKTGLTSLGEFMLEQMMRRGMLIEVDHFPRRSYKRAFELLEENDYPAVATHGTNYEKLHKVGGVAVSGFGRCHGREPGQTDDGYQNRLRSIVENGGFPGLGFSFDLNGFAGAPGPRFGERARCGAPQGNPITYPFEAYAGDVTLLEPKIGNRTIDFNTEGLVHIGMLPELIQDVRLDGVSDEDLVPLFKSAEGYIRMWEKAERRAAAIRSE